MTTIRIDRMTKQQIVQEMMKHSTEATASLLFDIYYLFITDQLDADYLEEQGRRFGIDLEREFIDRMTKQQEDEDDQVEP